MQKVLEKIKNIGIVPVVKLDSPKDAAPLSKALIDGGIPCAEITFRTDAAEESIRIISFEHPDMLVGAGTVTTMDSLERALSAGAQFIVSPGLNPSIVRACIERGVPVLPGAVTPTEIEQALELGIKTVKFFPAEPMGGLATIKALSGPYGELSFVPTGGISTRNIAEYLAFPKIIACGGSWMVDPKLISEGAFTELTRISRGAVESVLGFELAHVGVNCTSEAEVSRIADLFCTLFHLERRPTSSVVFAGNIVECGTSLPTGRHHIAIATNSVARAAFHLRSMGMEFHDDQAKYDASGNLLALYLKENFAGLSVHLLQKK